MSQVQIEGIVRLCLKDKAGLVVPGSHRELKNVVTTTGRTFLAQRCSVNADLSLINTNFIRYMAIGTGTRLEVTEVDRLANSVTYDGNNHLKAVTLPPTFPISTTVRFSLEYADNQITFAGGAGVVAISEIGLFLGDAGEAADYKQSGLHPPVSYKTFEPINKTTSFRLSVEWEWRF